MVHDMVWGIAKGDLAFSGKTRLAGNGRSLVGATVTVKTPDWTPLDTADTGSAVQETNDNHAPSASADFAAQTRFETEYSFVATDGTKHWTFVAFNFANSAKHFGATAGFAVLGGHCPPSGRKLKVVSAQNGPRQLTTAQFTPPCFVAGTPIATDRGLKCVENLVEGDRVLTRDSGFQPVLTAIRRKYWAVGKCAPIEIAEGTLGAQGPMRVSAGHRLLVNKRSMHTATGQSEAFAKAGDLVNGLTIRRVEGGRVEYVQLLLPIHSLILSNGMWSESFYPGDTTMNGLIPAHRSQLETSLMQYGIAQYGDLARPMSQLQNGVIAA